MYHLQLFQMVRIVRDFLKTDRIDIHTANPAAVLKRMTSDVKACIRDTTAIAPQLDNQQSFVSDLINIRVVTN